MKGLRIPLNMFIFAKETVKMHRYDTSSDPSEFLFF